MFDGWIEELERACLESGYDIKEQALGRSSGPVPEVISSIDKNADYAAWKEELRRCFSTNKTRIHAASLLTDFRKQKPTETLRTYIYKYSKLH